MIRYIPILSALALILVFSGCRKGEDDPRFSMRTRKARLTGDWKLESGNAGLTSGGYNNTYTFMGMDYTRNESTSYTTYIGKYILNLRINKDGSFSFKEYLAGLTLEASGTWNFNTGIGSAKGKEEVVFIIDEVKEGYTHGNNIFNRFSTTFIYTIKELRNNRLVIHSKGKVYSDLRGRYVTLSTNYVFKQ